MRNQESAEQVAVIQWAKLHENKYPPLALLHHIPNGGYRNVATAARLKAEGVKAGVPDLCLPVARCGYHGLYIELKAGKNKVSDKQAWWLSKLNDYGYLAVWCLGADEAIEIIKAYLENRINTKESK